MRNITMILLLLCINATAQIRTNEIQVETRDNVRIEDPTYIVEPAEVKPNFQIQDGKTGRAFTVTPYFQPTIAVGTHYVQGIKIQQRNAYQIPSGIVDNGYRMALDISGHVTEHSNFFGRLKQQTGIRLHHGAHTNSGPGTITNVVGLHLIGLENGGATLTNKWSLFQVNSGFNNFFQGKLRIGGPSEMGTPPTEQLEVVGNIDLNGNIDISGNVTSNLTTHGTITSGGNVTVNGDLSVTGDVNGSLTTTGPITSGGNVHANGGFYGGNGLEVYNLRGYGGGSRTATINLRAANKNFHANVTITGQQGNLHNEKHMWHGAVTYDHTHNQMNVYTISSQGVNVSVQKNNGQIQLMITSTAGYGLYVVYRGTAMISSGT